MWRRRDFALALMALILVAPETRVTSSSRRGVAQHGVTRRGVKGSGDGQELLHSTAAPLGETIGFYSLIRFEYFHAHETCTVDYRIFVT